MSPGRIIGGLLALAIGFGAAPAAAQLAALEPATTILGEVCEDPGKDGRCDAEDPPLAGAVVRTLRGTWVRTDARGRFRLPVIGARSFALDEGGQLRPRLEHLYLFLDARSLGAAASTGDGASPGQWVDLIPGGTVPVSFAVPVARSAAVRAPLAGRESGGFPAVARQEQGLVLRVPVELMPGHQILLDGRALSPDAEGRVEIPVPLAGREGTTVFLDREPGGSLRVESLRALRVPYENGTQLLVHRPVETLLRLELPAGAVAPGVLRVVVRGAPGTTLILGDGTPLTLDAEGRGQARVAITEGPLPLILDPEGAGRRELSLPLEVDPRLLRTLHLAADLRAGFGGGLFGEGRAEVFGETPLLGGRLGGGLQLSDARGLELGRGGRPISLGAGPIYQRSPDPEIAGMAFADESVVVDENPADLALWGGWRGEAGRVVLAPGRAPLSGPEVGRFDRATLGPDLALATRAGPARLSFAAAADGWGVPLLDDPEVLPAHAELAATGGAFYRLPHRSLAEGSERLFVEYLDPITGLPLDRRLLARGRDYEIDYESGRVLLAVPLGLSGVAPAARLGASRLGGPARLTADYQVRAGAEGVGYAGGGARAAVETRWLSVGVQAAGVNAGRYGLLAADLSAAPASWFSVSAAVARSAGDPFLSAGGFAQSLDGGEHFVSPLAPPRDTLEGLAASLRLSVGGEGPVALELAGRLRSEGFADGASLALVRERAGSARLRVGDEDLGLRLSAGLSEGADDTLRGEASRGEARLRGHARLGDFGLALEGGFEQQSRTPDSGRTPASGTRVEGSRTSAGLELSWRASESLELLVGHLQGIGRSGGGPGADDPTFTSVGVRAALPGLGRLEARGGLHLDGRPALRLAWLAEQKGSARYASFATDADRPWDGQAQSSVVGGRQVIDGRTSVFAESRAGEDEAGSVSAGTAVGGRWGDGPLSLALTYERAARPGESRLQLRDGLHLRAGWASRRLSLSAFGENTRAYSGDAALGFTRRTVGGATAVVTPGDGLALSVRALAAEVEGGGLSRSAPELELSAGAVYRPRTGLLSLALAHYGVEADPRVENSGLWHRRHLARVAFGLGRGPGPNLTLAGVLAVDEARWPATASQPGQAPAARALVGTLRLAWPIAHRVEPVLEVGLRRLWGAGEAQVAPTVRLEVLGVLGPLRVGLGGAITGFTGEGIEPVTGEPAAPRIYLVLRGAR